MKFWPMEEWLMYSILIAEDEDIIRKGLIKMISKMRLPIDIFYEARNGREALEYVYKFSPSIVITDIKMPVMDGLDLIGQIRKFNTNIKSIILSGYNEFSFAQKAIGLNVNEYLLKPIGKDELYNVMVKVINQLKIEEEETRQKAIKDIKIKEYQSIVLKEILDGQNDAQFTNIVIADAGITFAKQGFCVIAMYCSQKSDLAKNYFVKYIGRYICCIYINKYNNIICLVNINKEELNGVVSAISNGVDSFGNDASLGISDWSKDVKMLHGLALHAEEALDFRMVDDKRRIFSYIEIKKCKTQQLSLDVYFQEISNAIKVKNFMGLSSSIDSLFCFFKKSNAIPQVIKDSIEKLLLSNMTAAGRNIFDIPIEAARLFKICSSISDYKICIKQIILKIWENKGDNNQINSGNKIRIAIKYIEKNYEKDLSLQEVADYVNLNPSYLSYIFKKATGLNYRDFLNKVRVEKSKVLLIQPKYKVYEIAEKVGFIDTNYYYRVFKKYTGITPNQYRYNLSNI